MPIEGIDVSEHNGSIDWKQVRKAGKRFVFLKVNEGDHIDARLTAARVDAVRAAGLVVGGYNFARPRPGRTGAEEFDLHHHAAKGVGLYHRGDMRPVLDLEASKFDVSNDAGRRATLAYARSWVKRCVSVTGHHPILYTGYYWRDTLQDPNTTLSCQLWFPCYPTIKAVPKAWGPDGVTIHQYSEHGRVAGITGDVDLNRFLGAGNSLLGMRKLRRALCLKH